MTKYMILDTETSGLPRGRAPPTNLMAYETCRIVEIGYVIFDNDTWNVEKKRSILIDVPFPIMNHRFHGITNEMCSHEGIKIYDALTELMEEMSKVDMFICHNVNFDKNVVLSEMHRCKHPGIKELTRKKNLCTMKDTELYRRTDKFIKLDDLFKSLFPDEPTPSLHRALDDCMVVHRCLQEIEL